jgi:hypothetical protein
MKFEMRVPADRYTGPPYLCCCLALSCRLVSPTSPVTQWVSNVSCRLVHIHYCAQLDIVAFVDSLFITYNHFPCTGQQMRQMPHTVWHMPNGKCWWCCDQASVQPPGHLHTRVLHPSRDPEIFTIYPEVRVVGLGETRDVALAH